MLDLSAKSNLSYALLLMTKFDDVKSPDFWNIGMNYKTNATHKLNSCPVGSEFWILNILNSSLYWYFRATRLSSSTWSISVQQPVTNLPDWHHQSWQEAKETHLSQSKILCSIMDMTICLKDHQTHHVQAPPKYLKGILVIPIPVLLMTKAMAVITTITWTRAQFMCHNPNLKSNSRTSARYSCWVHICIIPLIQV